MEVGEVNCSITIAIESTFIHQKNNLILKHEVTSIFMAVLPGLKNTRSTETSL
ncbi:hypothetical protein PCIT_a1301 [Pseudoalteromonas citrea]|uniref:Uncharacterized protein n=1 Tax=Pseudoalteromonas citrea TaxID=43655 RepID=A0AAD4ALY7_9GAMM|nr:hypothetical protein PCIT_a1301 [Pseudoalteromonas citrea]